METSEVRSFISMTLFAILMASLNFSPDPERMGPFQPSVVLKIWPGSKAAFIDDAFIRSLDDQSPMSYEGG